MMAAATRRVASNAATRHDEFAARTHVHTGAIAVDIVAGDGTARHLEYCICTIDIHAVLMIASDGTAGQRDCYTTSKDNPIKRFLRSF